MRLAREFGVQLITENEINTLRELTGEVHYLIRRGFFYAHRDLQSILNRQRSG